MTMPQAGPCPHRRASAGPPPARVRLGPRPLLRHCGGAWLTRPSTSRRTGSIARITLNRPDRLNSFTAAMHEELKEALNEVTDARVIVLPAPAAASALVIARASRARPSGRPARHDRRDRLEPACPEHHPPAAAGHRASERRRSRRGREHRTGLRHGRRGEVGQVHPELLCDRPHPRRSGGTWRPAPRRPCARWVLRSPATRFSRKRKMGTHLKCVDDEALDTEVDAIA